MIPRFATIALLALAGALLSLSPRTAHAESFSFAQYGDIHLIDTATTTTALLNRLADFINTGLPSPVDFVVDTGDTYQGGDPRDVFSTYRKALSALRIPAYALRGNHDIAPGFPTEAWQEAMDRKANFSFVHKGVAFIGFDTAVNEPSWQNPSASPRTLDWLAAEDRKLSPGMPVVLFTHVPLASRMGLPKVYPLVNRQKVLDLFNDQKLLAVISGHYHGAKESVENGVLFTTTPTFSPNRANHDGQRGGAVRLFTIQDGTTVSTRRIPFPDFR